MDAGFRTTLVAATCFVTLLFGNASPASAQAAPGGLDSKAFAAYSKCLKKHGVKLALRNGAGGGARGSDDAAGTPPPLGDETFPGPGSGPPASLPEGVTPKKLAKAQKACRSKLPDGLEDVPGFGGGGGNAQESQAYLSCLRDHGVTVPEPGRSGRDSDNGPPTFDPNDPAFQAANAICGALAPGGATTTTTTSSTT